MLKLLIPIFLIFSFYSVSISQSSGGLLQNDSGQLSLAARVEQFQPNHLPVLQIEHCPGPIQMDGELNDSGWASAVVASNFCEINPGDQTKPPIEIKTLLTYDQDNLYVAFVVEDNPKAIRASLRNRDEMFSDDYVGVLLDTYGDASWAYYLFSNPLGIQGDERYSSTSGEDVSFDLIFESKGKITDKGYQVEMAIPFRSLRFPDRGKQTWRANFWITHPRDSRRQYSWAAIDRDEPCFLCQYGTLTGIENASPGKSVELIPSLVGSQAGFRGDSGFHEGHVDQEASLGVRYGITPSITAEVTYNPDFSQVESDADQIDVNNTFALFYSEKRPFFQEGSDLFDTWIKGVYTRSINDPLLAARLTGRMGRTSLAYLVARDEHTPVILPFQERSAVLNTGLRSTSNLFRFKQTFLEDSHIGVLVTDRRLDGGSGTVLGLDGVIRVKRFSRNYRLRWQALLSHTQEPQDTLLTTGVSQTTFDDGKHTTTFDGESFRGHALYAGLNRDARLWNFNLNYSQTSPTFRADNGFVTRSDRREVEFWSSLFFRPNTRWVYQIIPTVELGRVWNFAGTRKDEWVMPAVEFQLRGQTFVSVLYLASQELYQKVFFGGIRGWQLEFNSEFSDPLKIGFWFSRGHRIARFEDPPILGKETDFNAWATIKPWQSFIIQPQVSYSKLTHPENDSDIFKGYIFRTRFNYQFSHQFYMRLVVQYNDFDQELSIEPLLSYKLNPFTIFYVGSSHQYVDLNSDDKLTQTSRQFFLKLQYLLRL